MLAAICAAIEPLGRELLAEASGLDAETELPRVLVRLAAYIPRQPGADGKPAHAVFHKSFADWLTDPQRAGQLHHVSLGDGHRRLAGVCCQQRGVFARWKTIHEILKPEHWRRFKLAHEEQGWLLSHAGFHPVWIEEPTVEKILRRCSEAVLLAARGNVDSILRAGERGGSQRFGGPLWMDRKSLVPIPGVHQIVGHTPGNQVREKSIEESRNFCLDVKNASLAGLLCDGCLEILR